MKKLRVATRGSQLALWQANHVKQLLEAQDPKLHVELVPVKTTGDRVQNKLLADIGGKGLFIKELEFALLNDIADIAVHSMKDVPPIIPAEFCIPAILPRADARDAFVSIHYKNFAELPQGAIVGTCSPRRQAQLLYHRPDLNIKALRGNVDTRLNKLKQGEFDAVILAVAGLQRLGLASVISEYLAVDFMLPSVAQGAIGIECLTKKHTVVNLLELLNDKKTATCVNIERDCVQQLNGDCHSPIGSYAIIEGNYITLQALRFENDKRYIHIASTTIEQATTLGTEVANALIQQCQHQQL
jgi:hydroxymethylbilane synthase